VHIFIWCVVNVVITDTKNIFRPYARQACSHL